MPTTFSHGQLVMTPGARDAFTEKERHDCLTRHLAGDWGNLTTHDTRANNQALKNGDRLMSSYDFPALSEEGRTRHLWIVTEADRSVTTLLLPEDY